MNFKAHFVASTLFVASLATALGASAEPLPVHTATTRITQTSLPLADRLLLADEVARVLTAEGVTEVISATEVRNRLATLQSPGDSCDSASCANLVWGPVRGRAVVLVRQARTRGRLLLNIEYVNLRGEVVAREDRDEAIAGWPEAIVIARVATQRLAQRLRDELRVEGVRTPPQVTPPDNSGQQSNGANAQSGNGAQQSGNTRTVVALPMVPQVQFVRRPWEIGLGAGVAAVGLLTTGFMAYNLVVHNTTTQDSADVAAARETLRCAVGSSVSNNACDGIGVVTPLLLGVGIAAIAGGVVLMVDGLQRRPQVVPGSTPAPQIVRVGGVPIAQGGLFTLGGTF